MPAPSQPPMAPAEAGRAGPPCGGGGRRLPGQSQWWPSEGAGAAVSSLFRPALAGPGGAVAQQPHPGSHLNMPSSRRPGARCSPKSCLRPPRRVTLGSPPPRRDGAPAPQAGPALGRLGAGAPGPPWGIRPHCRFSGQWVQGAMGSAPRPEQSAAQGP